MGDKSKRNVFGRDKQNEAGDAQWGNIYIGEQMGEHEAFADVGLGLYNGDKFDLLQANAQTGIWEQDGG